MMSRISKTNSQVFNLILEIRSIHRDLRLFSSAQVCTRADEIDGLSLSVTLAGKAGGSEATSGSSKLGMTPINIFNRVSCVKCYCYELVRQILSSPLS